MLARLGMVSLLLLTASPLSTQSYARGSDVLGLGLGCSAFTF